MSEGRVVKSGVKRVKTLYRLSPSSCASIRCWKLKNGRNFSVVSTGNELIYIMEDHELQRILNVHSPVVKVLDCFDIEESILVVTKDGKLWTLPQSNKLEQKDNSLRIDDVEVPESNVEIFAELLGDTDTSEKLQSMSHGPIMVQCSKEQVIHWEPGLCNVVFGTDHVITCCKYKDNAVRLSVYPRSDAFRGGSADSRRISPNVLYRTMLTTGISGNTENQRGAAVLLYLKPGDGMDLGCTSCAIDQQFFHAIFRTCSSVHVVLVGTDLGMVGYVPVGAGIHGTNIPPEVLYHLEQPVSAMFAMCLSADNHTSLPNSLILVGSLGKLIFVTLKDAGQRDARKVEFREYHVPGPIVSATVSRDTLFYSTLKELYAVPLICNSQKLEDRERHENPSMHRLPLSLAPILLPFPKVCAMAIELESPAPNTTSLLCVKTDGHVLLVEQPLARKLGCRAAQVASSGESIKQYLADIQEKSNCVGHLSRDIQELDNVIKQLNIVTRVVWEIIGTRESHASCTPRHFSETCNEINPGMDFQVQVDYEAEGGHFNPLVVLRCDFVNSTKYLLSRGWSLVIQVRTKQPWFNENCEAPQVVSRSVSLDSSSTYRVSIPLDATLVSYLFAIQVSCYICFDMKEILPVAILTEDSDPALTQGFAILVQDNELCVLHFLRNVDNPTSSSEGHRPSTNQIQALQETLKKLNSSLQSPAPDEPSKKPEVSAVSVHLSKEAVEYIHKSITKSISTETHLEGPHSKELSVLYFLLWDSRRHLHFDNVVSRGNSVHTRVPNEDEVKFQVVHSGHGDGLEVRVHTSSEVLRCSVHAAVLRVLEPVLQRKPDKKTGIPIGQLQKRLTKLKEIQTSLDLLRESCPMQADAKVQAKYNSRRFDKLVNIYKELRKVPTLVP